MSCPKHSHPGRQIPLSHCTEQKTKVQRQRTHTQKFSILLNYFLLLFQGNVASREFQGVGETEAGSPGKGGAGKLDIQQPGAWTS